MANDPNQGQPNPGDKPEKKPGDSLDPDQLRADDSEETLFLSPKGGSGSDSGSGVDLGTGSSSEGDSGTSDVNWGVAADSPSASDSASSGIHLDSPSDAEVRKQAERPAAGETPSAPQSAPLRSPTTLRPMAPQTVLAPGQAAAPPVADEPHKRDDAPTIIRGPAGAAKDPSAGGKPVESGIDLVEAYVQDVDELPPTPSSAAEDVEFEAKPTGEVVSSAVDLGGPAGELAEDKELPPASSGLLAGSSFNAAVNLDELPPEEARAQSSSSSSAVDLGSLPDDVLGSSERGPVESEFAVSALKEKSSADSSTRHADSDAVDQVGAELTTEADVELGGSAVENDQDEGRPKKKAKPARKPAVEDEEALVAAGPRQGRGGAWFGGTVLGALLGAGACVGLAFVNVNIPEMAHNALTRQSSPTKPGSGGGQSDKQAAGPSAVELLRSGDFDRAAQAGIDKTDDTDPKTLAARGEFRWLSYLRKQRAAKAPLLATDEDVKNAEEDLKKAGTADAAFWLGHIEEATGNIDGARKTYSDAAAKFKDDARRFQAALHRLDLRAEKPAAPAGASRARPWEVNEALVAALLFTNLQQDNPKGDDKAKKKDESKEKKRPDALDDEEKTKKKADRPRDEEKKKDDEKKKADDRPKDVEKKKDDEKKKADDRPKDEEKKKDDKPAPAVNDTDEAGFEFWTAAKLAREQQYDQALQALEKARAIHDVRRFTQLRKAQNPLSDPTEEVFLRACDELRVAWEIKDRLNKGGYLAEVKDPTKAVENLVGKAKEAGEISKSLSEKLIADKVIEKPDELAAGIDQLLKRNKAAFDVGKKLVDEKIAEKPEDLDKGVDTLLAVKKAADAVAEKLVKAKIIDKPQDADKGVDALLSRKKADDDLADRLVKEKVQDQPDLGKGVDQLLTDRKAAAAKVAELTMSLAGATGTLKQIGDDLAAAKYFDGKGSPVQGVKKALDMAAVKDPKGLIRNLQADLGKARTVLGVSRTPRDMLSVWLPQLQIGSNVAGAAAVDADRVLADPDASPTQKVQAECLKGLVEWSQQKWEAARPRLEKGLAALPRGDSAWRAKVQAALESATDPAWYYLSAAKDAEARGKVQDALTSVKAALDVAPENDKASALLYRGQLEYQVARSKNRGKLTAREPELVAAQKSLAAAAKAGLPQAHYLLGQIAEELGRWSDAEMAYRAAVKASPKIAGSGGVYRAALASVLLRDRQARPAAAVPVGPPPKEETKPAPKPAAKDEKSTSLRPTEIDRDVLTAMLALMTVGFQFPSQLPNPAQQEAMKLADEILAAPADQVPFEARAKALAIKGHWSRALQTYVDGLRPYLKREHAEGLLDLVNNHPILKRPESTPSAEGNEAEKYYSSGLRHYFARRYADAEKELNAAIEQDGQDARFYYFLGLAKMAQNKRDAVEDLKYAAKLETEDKPGTGAVSQALERVQGRSRRALNEIRDAARQN